MNNDFALAFAGNGFVQLVGRTYNGTFFERDMPVTLTGIVVALMVYLAISASRKKGWL